MMYAVVRPVTSAVVVTRAIPIVASFQGVLMVVSSCHPI
jgi:hypothetical protein